MRVLFYWLLCWSIVIPALLGIEKLVAAKYQESMKSAADSYYSQATVIR